MNNCYNDMKFSSHNIEFRSPNINDIDELNENFEECHWLDSYIESIEHNDVDYLRILTFDNVIIGLSEFYNTGYNFNGINIFYISIRCTRYKKAPISNEYFKTEEGKFVTTGRLLWAYILNDIYNMNSQEKFIIYNHAIPNAYWYHIKMGMKPIRTIIIDGVNIKYYMKQLFLEQSGLNTADLSDASINSDEFDDTYLFYVYDENINYNCIEDIIKSLPDYDRLNYKFSQGTSYISRKKFRDRNNLMKNMNLMKNINSMKSKREQTMNRLRIGRGGKKYKTKRYKIKKNKTRKYKIRK